MAEGATVRLYRAVSEAEFEQVMRKREFVVDPYRSEGKFFAETLEDAH